jgi:hypothetical protein
MDSAGQEGGAFGFPSDGNNGDGNDNDGDDMYVLLNNMRSKKANHGYNY